MVKPLHAGLAARNGVLAAELSRAGMTASERAIDGPQGFLVAMDGEQRSLDPFIADFGTCWEIIDTGVTVKLYPSCAATHPPLDALLDLKRRERFDADDVDAIEVGVDAITPTVRLCDRPASALEGKFSLPFCAAAAVVDGAVGLETFDAPRLRDPRILALQSRVTMTVDPTLDPAAAALTQARVTVRLKDGRVLIARANGARGYPANPATDDELAAKFLSCAGRAMSDDEAHGALETLRHVEAVKDVREITAALSTHDR